MRTIILACVEVETGDKKENEKERDIERYRATYIEKKIQQDRDREKKIE